jgi:hypothetical protein
MRILTLTLLSIVILALISVASFASTKQIRSESNYCAEINDPSSGTEILLEPGIYHGGCQIKRGGTRSTPLIIRGLTANQRPRIQYEEKHGNVLEIYADNIILDGLQLGPTYGEVDAIRIFAGNHVTVENCVFTQLGGIAVVANHASIQGLVVRHNRIERSASTALYFGCHDGVACTASDLLLEDNFINEVSAQGSQIGYGIQVKLNSSGTIRRNIILNTKGPGIMVYGGKDSTELSLIEANYVSSSRESAGIVLGGGPALVRNNILTENSDGGIALEDYGRRGLLRDIVVAHNTMYRNSHGGVRIPAGDRVSAEIVRNLVAAGPSADGFVSWPGEREGLRVTGNKECRNINCFRDPENGDFTPAAASALATTADASTTSARPSTDYFGHIRGKSVVPGAIELPGGRVAVDARP